MNIKKIIEAEFDSALTLLHDLCLIPAPSGKEEKRAEYCLEFFKGLGLEDAYIDESKNAVCFLGPKDGDIVLFMAHTDTVFPDEAPLPYSEDEKNIYCPGVGDDTACLAIMMSCIKYMVQNGITPKRRLMFVANSCEEGLGNLKGCRQIFKDYGDKIVRMYTFDGMCDAVVNKSVGSHRYKVTIKTEGGHSFNHFGNRNAIAVLTEIIGKIYTIEVPKVKGSKTTYNVGTVEGGTSVNTIAQEASALVEYRSDNVTCLSEMEKKFSSIFDNAREKCKELIVERVGERPCMDGVDEAVLSEMTENVVSVQKKYGDVEVAVNSGSTDCNIPHSLGIPAICVGVYMGGGMHTREEWLEKDSIKTGLCIALELILDEG
ncbi:MAG: M20/M25/M40 family metallo-hydrolase [Clostridia bacterium]|nr:M20/M25/M40 family metallo-hydrolase [Clostridia bacterium]